MVCCPMTAKVLIDSETYLVFHRPGSHVDIKVYDARVQEHRRLPPAERLDNLLKYSLMVKAELTEDKDTSGVRRMIA